MWEGIELRELTDICGPGYFLGVVLELPRIFCAATLRRQTWVSVITKRPLASEAKKYGQVQNQVSCSGFSIVHTSIFSPVILSYGERQDETRQIILPLKPIPEILIHNSAGRRQGQGMFPTFVVEASLSNQNQVLLNSGWMQSKCYSLNTLLTFR